MEVLRYRKIINFINTLNTREKKYLIKKIQEEIINKEITIVNFTINGKKVI